MTDKELKKLSRAELLEMLLVQSKKLEQQQKHIGELEAKLRERELRQKELGSIAEAALQLNGVFQAAQQAADQYLENAARMEEESRAKQEEAAALYAQTKEKCAKLETETTDKCLQMEAASRLACQEHWDDLLNRLEGYTPSWQKPEETQ